MVTAMQSVLSNVSFFIRESIFWVGHFLEFVTDNVALTLFVIAVPLVGLGIGLLNRLFRTN